MLKAPCSDVTVVDVVFVVAVIFAVTEVPSSIVVVPVTFAPSDSIHFKLARGAGIDICSNVSGV